MKGVSGFISTAITCFAWTELLAGACRCLPPISVTPRQACDVPPGPAEAGDQPGAYRIADGREHDRDGRGGGLRRLCRECPESGYQRRPACLEPSLRPSVTVVLDVLQQIGTRKPCSCPRRSPARGAAPAAAFDVVSSPGVRARKQTRYTFPAGCASAASGAARRLPAMSPMKARRGISGERIEAIGSLLGVWPRVYQRRRGLRGATCAYCAARRAGSCGGIRGTQRARLAASRARSAPGRYFGAPRTISSILRYPEGSMRASMSVGPGAVCAAIRAPCSVASLVAASARMPKARPSVTRSGPV